MIAWLESESVRNAKFLHPAATPAGNAEGACYALDNVPAGVAPSLAALRLFGKRLVSVFGVTIVDET